MMTPTRQLPNVLIPPWPTRVAWRAANDAMATAVCRHGSRLKDLVALADQISRRLKALAPLIESLCSTTCPVCVDNCCQRATVWFDFKDLLGFHLNAAPEAPGKLIAAPGQTCRYLTKAGCELPRTFRPYVCTWFICAAHKRGMDLWPLSRQMFVRNSLQAIKQGRIYMETLFIQRVVK